MNVFNEATIYQLCKVVKAADDLYKCEAEFMEDYPEACGEYRQALDEALEGCPGTSGNYYKQQQAKGSSDAS